MANTNDDRPRKWAAPALLRQAADTIERHAIELQRSHTVCGIWSGLSPYDQLAHIEYERDLRLVQDLRDLSFDLDDEG